MTNLPIKERIYMTPGDTKECAGCHAVLPASFDHFYKRTRSNGITYLSSLCKTCAKRQRSESRAANPEKSLIANRENYKKHGKMPDEFMAYREFIKTNSEEINKKRIYMRDAMRRHRSKIK